MKCALKPQMLSHKVAEVHIDFNQSKGWFPKNFFPPRYDMLLLFINAGPLGKFY